MFQFAKVKKTIKSKTKYFSSNITFLSSRDITSEYWVVHPDWIDSGNWIDNDIGLVGGGGVNLERPQISTRPTKAEGPALLQSFGWSNM